MTHSSLSDAWIDSPTPVILALPGGGCSPAIYDKVRVPGHLVHALDYGNGSGPHDVQAIAARVAGQLALRTAGPTALIGHSVGAGTAALVAAQASRHLRALVLTNTGVNSSKHGDPSLPERIRTDWTRSNQEAFLRACFHVPPPPALWQQLVDYLAALPRESMLETVMSLRALDLTDVLPRIAVPTLILHGEFDQRRHVADAEALARGIPGAQLVLVPGGHTPMVDCPDEYNAALQAFLEGPLHNSSRRT